MNSHELRKKLVALLGGWCGEMRECVVTVSRAAYGKPSMVLIEWQGSPSRTKICINAADELSTILVGQKVLRFSNLQTSKHAKVRKLIMSFLQDGGYLDGIDQSQPIIRNNDDLLSAYEHLHTKTDQLYQASKMIVAHRIDHIDFDMYLRGQTTFNDLCQIAEESDANLQF